jgi:hypothetical protein
MKKAEKPVTSAMASSAGRDASRPSTPFSAAIARSALFFKKSMICSRWRSRNSASISLTKLPSHLKNLCTGGENSGNPPLAALVRNSASSRTPSTVISISPDSSSVSAARVIIPEAAVRPRCSLSWAHLMTGCNAAAISRPSKKGRE